MLEVLHTGRQCVLRYIMEAISRSSMATSCFMGVNKVKQEVNGRRGYKGYIS